MRLVACPECHAQFDVTEVDRGKIDCPCGASVDNVSHTPVDAEIHRCAACGALLTPKAQRCDYCQAAVVREGDLSLICPECYARNADYADYCTNCGVAFQPQPVWDDESELDCPACQRKLRLRGVAGVGVSECAACNGLWVPGDSFDTLVDRAADAHRRSPTEGLGFRKAHEKGVRNDTGTGSWKIEYRKCPVCSGVMQRRNFGRRSGVIVDVCRQHGTWLDKDELEAIATFIDRGGMQDARLVGETEDLLPPGARTPDQVESWMEMERQLNGRKSIWTEKSSKHEFEFSLVDVLRKILGG